MSKFFYNSTFFGVLFLMGGLLLVSTAAIGQDTEPAPVEEAAAPEKEVNEPPKFYNIPEKSVTRGLLNSFTFGVSTGYGKTFYKHELDGLSILQTDSDVLVFDNGSLTNYSNWFNKVDSATSYVASPTDLRISSDTTTLGYKSVASSIPLMFTVHYEYDRYRFGIGAEFEFHTIKEFKPTSHASLLRSYDSPMRKATFKRYFINLGARVYRYWEYSLVVDAQIGTIKYGKNFDLGVIKKGAYFNLGATVEREFSEYFSVFVRPSYEFKSFTTSIPETSLSVKHNQPAFFVHVGAFIRIPELRKCKIRNCQVQINHTHGGGKNWRSRMHPFYKKQNPHYGENFPKLVKYKGENRKKINPY